MNNNSEPKTERGKITKNKLLTAAEEVFGTYGFHQTGIVEITQKAHVSLGTFYTYFESKDMIFADLLIGYQRELRKRIKEETKGVTERLKLEEIGYRTFFQFLKEHPYMLRILRQSEFVDEELHRKYFAVLTKGYIEGMSESVANGEIRGLNPEFLVYAFMGISDYIGMKWILWEDRDVEECVDQMMSLIKHGIQCK
jgi:AcrR family transcriptional regulator